MSPDPLTQTPAGYPAFTPPQAAGGLPDLPDVREILRILKRRRLTIFSAIGIGAFLALLLAFILTPIYSSTAVVMLDPRHQQVLDVQAVLSSYQVNDSVVRSQIDILTSRTMADRVINKLALDKDPEFNPNLMPVPLLQYLNPMSWIPKEWFTAAPNGLTELEKRDLERGAIIDTLLENLTVTNDGWSYALRVSFKSTAAVKASRIANAFADEYLVDQLETKFEANNRANEWLKGRLDALRDQVETSEKAVQDFRTKTGLTRVSTDETITTQQLAEINTMLVRAQTDKAQAEARLRSAQDMLRQRGGYDAAADVLASPLIQALREQESQVRRKEAELATRYGEKHPQMQNIRAERRDLQSKIAEEVIKVVRGLENEVDIASAKEASIKAQLDGLEKAQGANMQEQVQLNELERQATANRTLYESFLNRYKETSAQGDMQQADARVIARAEVPLQAYFPKKILFLLAGLLLGGFIGVFIAFLIEFFDRGFRGAAQVEQATGLPTLALIPSLAAGEMPEKYILEKPLSAFSESLRTARTALHFSNVDAPPKIIMVTSSLPGEGKSTFCITLARSLALAGNRILLIDADLRRPRIGRVLGGADHADLADVLGGQKTLAEALQKDAESGMDYVVARGKTPNPQDILGSQQMKKLLETVRQDYDLVIIDTPPILAVSDAAMVGQHADACAFVIRWAETPRDVALAALNQLKNFSLKVSGVLLTQMNLEQHNRYGYSDYGYYYGRYREYYSN